MRTDAGYRWLIKSHHLPVIGLWQQCYIDSAVRGRVVQSLGDHRIQLFEPRYQPEDTLTAHLQFALRYEGVNLQLPNLRIKPRRRIRSDYPGELDVPGKLEESEFQSYWAYV